MKIKKVAIFFGGNSSERNISIKSGFSVLRSLLNMGFDVYPIDMKYFSMELFLKNKFDKVFISLHGKNGEDGTIQGLLEFLNIPYTGSGIFASSISIDKYRTKKFLKSFGINVIPDFYINKGNFFKVCPLGYFDDFFCDKIISKLGFPLLIKPNDQGSSIGINLVKNIIELKFILNKCFSDFGNVLIEKYIYGDEYTVGIVSDDILPSIKIKYKNNFYDFNSKYFCKDIEYFFTDKLNKNLEKSIMDISWDIWKFLGCKGYGRIDFLLDKNDKFWFLEINTIPGMTHTSLVPLAAKYIGINFDNLIKKILYS